MHPKSTSADPAFVHAVRAVVSLGRDLADGTWDRRFGHLRRQPTFVGALRLIVARSRTRV